MTTFHVPLKRVVDDSYDVEIGADLFDTLVEDLRRGLAGPVGRYALITDANVEPLYGAELFRRLREHQLPVSLFSFPAGEKFKTRAVKAELEDRMLAEGFGRDSCVIALGGGVVTDLAGFVAATFARGVPFVNYATTLLAAADASVGGKTAVDTPVATNLVGAFHQPAKVYVDVDTWRTLPLREVRCGLAETIKHACLADREFFEFLERKIPEILPRGEERFVMDRAVWEHVAQRNCRIKYDVVKADERERNLRQVLNLGHTAGRALETLTDYRLLHGEAVAVGLVVQARLSAALGYLPAADAERVERLLRRAGLPTRIPARIDPETLVRKMRTDKKVRAGRIRFVLQRTIGAVQRFADGACSRPVDEQAILPVVRALTG